MRIKIYYLSIAKFYLVLRKVILWGRINPMLRVKKNVKNIG